MAEPVGPVTFRCPLAVRSTCPPARCTAATISLASLDRQRLGVTCFFSAIAADPQHPKDMPIPSSWTAPSPRASPTPRRNARRDTVVQLPDLAVRHASSTVLALARAVQARGRHAPTMPLSEGGTDGGQRRSHRACPGAGQICHTGYGAAEDRPGRRGKAVRRGRRAAAGGGPGQPAGVGGRARPGTIAGGLAGREAPACLGWRRGNHSAGDGGEGR